MASLIPQSGGLRSSALLQPGDSPFTRFGADSGEPIGWRGGLYRGSPKPEAGPPMPPPPMDMGNGGGEGLAAHAAAAPISDSGGVVDDVPPPNDALTGLQMAGGGDNPGAASMHQRMSAGAINPRLGQRVLPNEISGLKVLTY